MSAKKFSPGQEKFAHHFMKKMGEIQAWLIMKTGGRFGNSFLFMAPVGLLQHKGAKSGVIRVSPLVFLKKNKNIVIVASKAGSSGNPAWYYNLKANPQCSFQVKRVKRDYLARQASAEEKQQLWPELLNVYSGYDSYQERASDTSGRDIPVIILEPYAV